MINKFHRDAPEISADPAERRARVRWLMSHRLWQYPVSHREPPPGREDVHFGIPDEHGFVPWISDGPDWITTEVWLGSLHECASFEFVYVDPTTETIEDDEERNTAFRVWIEAGGWYDRSKEEHEPVPPEGWNDHNKWAHYHSLELDCGAPDAESALLELAARVEFFYDEDGKRREGRDSCKGRFLDEDFKKYESGCEADSEGYCVRCGYEVWK